MGAGVFESGTVSSANVKIKKDMTQPIQARSHRT
eukprot:SAG31_NODE_12391_length_945_cov_1.451537_3_plen_33_part_01